MSHVKLMGGVTPQFGGLALNLVLGGSKNPNIVQTIAPNNKHAIQEISNERTHVSRTPKKREYLIALVSPLAEGAPLRFGSIQFWMDVNKT